MVFMRLLEQSVAGFTVESIFRAPNAPAVVPRHFAEMHVWALSGKKVSVALGTSSNPLVQIL